LHVLDAHPELLGEHRDGAVLVEPGHRGEALARHVGGVVHRDQGVGVRRVADDQDPHVVGGTRAYGLSLGLEDRPVRLQEVGALHPLLARPGADQHRDVGAVEGLVRVGGYVHGLEQGEGAVVELHRGALRRLERRLDLEQLQADLLVGPSSWPEAIRNRMAYPIAPAAPVTVTVLDIGRLLSDGCYW
jgi:hypothetical protein